MLTLRSNKCVLCYICCLSHAAATSSIECKRLVRICAARQTQNCLICTASLSNASRLNSMSENDTAATVHGAFDRRDTAPLHAHTCSRCILVNDRYSPYWLFSVVHTLGRSSKFVRLVPTKTTMLSERSASEATGGSKLICLGVLII